MTSVYVAGRQLSHAVAPDPGLCDPGEHLRQSRTAGFVLLLSSAKVPGPHVEHTVAPGAEELPGGQVVHTVEESPSSSNVPAAQR